jgi:hypothetical protein
LPCHNACVEASRKPRSSLAMERKSLASALDLLWAKDNLSQ